MVWTGGGDAVVVCVPVTEDGEVDPRWGRARRVALAEVHDGRIGTWQEVEVGWDSLHDAGTEGGHHARVARFVADHGVQAVAAGHMGDPMLTMLTKLGIAVHLGAAGDARAAVLAVGDGPMPVP
jgi:predicted Fe-Mo cluster-binding NifX family protein